MHFVIAVIGIDVGSPLKVHVPPLKSQGIKTKLVPWIHSVIPSDFTGTWIEPFMGTGVVGFNLASEQATFGDTNPHVIRFYEAIQQQDISAKSVRQFLESEGIKLEQQGESYYYDVRDRFNKHHDPLDFLFLNRAGFNGMIRFNQKGGFNTPFCRKPSRFAPPYITKIVNQVAHIEMLMARKSFVFQCQSFDLVIEQAQQGDLIYCDPPYIGRHVDYYNGWSPEKERQLFEALAKTEARFILSTWHHNDYRENEYLKHLWHPFQVITREHYYHVGGYTKHRNPMIEAIVTNFSVAQTS